MNLIILTAVITIGILIVLMILIQRRRGNGFSRIAGGRGVEQSVFGTRTGDVFTLLTSTTFLLFIALAIYLDLHWR